MLGIIIILIVSWLLLHFIEKKNLSALGILSLPKALTDITIGFVFIVIITLLAIVLESWLLPIQWQINEVIDYKTIASSLLYYFKSALTEDLVFRGAILYILVSKLGFKTGLILSTITFGAYHWFSYGLLPSEDIRIIPLMYVFFITGFAGFVWAYAFIKTGSIMMPLGFHLGNNFILGLFYENNPYGELIFSQLSKGQFSNEYLYLLYLIIKGIFAPLLTLFFINYWVRKK